MDRRLLIDTDEIAFKAALRAEDSIWIVDGPEVPEEPTEDYLRKFGRKSKIDLYGDLVDEGDHKPEIRQVRVPGNFNLAMKGIKDTVEAYKRFTGASEAMFCFGSGINYRTEAAKINVYKGNRASRKPYYLKDAIEYILHNYPNLEMDGVETDDVLGISHTETSKNDTIIVSQDKDLRTIPGDYITSQERQVKTIEPYEALQKLYLQILIGDHVDHIRAIPGLGRSKGEKLLWKGCKTEAGMARAVLDTYRIAMAQPIEKRKWKTDAINPLPHVSERSVTSVVEEIAELVYIQRSDMRFEDLEVIKMCRKEAG